MSNLFNLYGRVALVTGVSARYGRASQVRLSTARPHLP